MQETKTELNVYSVILKILRGLGNSLDTSSTKATLANLRNSIGRPYEDSMETWAIIFENLPSEYLGRGAELTAEENSILNSLQLYAVHQQGKSENVNLEDTDCLWQNMGYALSSLRVGDNTSAVDRRFNAMVTSSTFEELCHHLRQLVKLLKAKSQSKVNYAKLADDFYWFLRGQKDSLRLDWSRQYYRIIGEEKDENK